ncbi:MAG: response regulator, partial [Burkholderiales bacterium]|nr:response regulator [Burkholderiales bacterium]MBV8659528.1 response regulator [Burkholderiales bacterium]
MSNRPLSALVIDGSAPVRTSLRGILQGFEMTDIDVAASVADGRRKIGTRKYDVILCEYHFDGEETGQDLLEQIAANRLQPPPTIFIMV